ncbi:hypothetical protein [Vibrio viridaestus]|uniref:Peptidase M15 n=1 Tax=Vibrio viridaestus TaxID=2487322 RepID=A0A3N9TET9_9VIBR|nr:hypothetical protein [Vibrio viridaestus]RQW62384.1 hypothetical protein EES38_14485 [Vibrio viridaestus]
MTIISIEKLQYWYKRRHPDYDGDNPISASSHLNLQKLCDDILYPVEREYGTVQISYGFTSPQLVRYLLRNSPKDMGPSLDQHASMEVNTKGNRICTRDGAACDFYVSGYESNMGEIAKFITHHLPYDRLYFYGTERPIHISVGPENTQYALIRYRNETGKRVNGKSATGSATLKLFNDLQ